jgi:cation diffusion facilitator CzcD-associated flavoprotein CzcO
MTVVETDRHKTPSVLIVGAGMSGLCMGIKLKQAGIDSFTIHEKADEVGGTWRENTYPGLVCDVPSRYYSYSFEPNPDWSSYYSPGGEIQQYFKRVADDYGLRSHIRFGSEVVSGRYEKGRDNGREGARWLVRTRSGEEHEADFLISACGVLHHPRYPHLEGLERFGGAMFHSSRWDHDVELKGRRIGVVGTGSTGVQLACALSEVAGRLTIFQRTAQWVFPGPNPRYRRITRHLMRRFPALNRLAYRGWQKYFEYLLGRATVQPGWQRRFVDRVCRLNLRTVRDPELRRKLTPDYVPMCKRLVVSSRFYRAVQQPNVEVVTRAIERVEPAGIVTADGALHELDVLVLATGFDAHAYLRPIDLVGEDELTLEDAWRDGAHAYRTIALPGFPNFFMLMGPHSPIGNQSLVIVAETQADYVMEWIRMFQAGEVLAAAPTAEATAGFNQEMSDAMPGTIWVTGCNSWYIGKDGLPELWPWTPDVHREMLRKPALEEFELRTGAGQRTSER